jgi:Cof subfamily protein (haloacid dehalogenase superfamily)
MPSGRSLRRISVVVSDIDGTLVTDDKTLTDRARAAVSVLHARGLGFALVSSRPPHAMRILTGPLGVTSPMAAFNGGLLVSPDGTALSRHLLDPAAAHRTIAIFADHGVQPWVFTEKDWLALDGAGPDVAHESLVVQSEPTIVAEFGRALDEAAKIVGVSPDPDVLSRCEAATRSQQPGAVTVGRSNPKHFDVTHPVANKGAALLAIADWFGVPAGEVATIGDGENDIAMFEQAGLSIAMGNAGPNVRAKADLVTASCNDDGFAKAMERLLGSGAVENTHSRQDRP